MPPFQPNHGRVAPYGAQHSEGTISEELSYWWKRLCGYRAQGESWNKSSSRGTKFPCELQPVRYAQYCARNWGLDKGGHLKRALYEFMKYRAKCETAGLVSKANFPQYYTEEELAMPKAKPDMPATAETFVEQTLKVAGVKPSAQTVGAVAQKVVKAFKNVRGFGVKSNRTVKRLRAVFPYIHGNIQKLDSAEKAVMARELYFVSTDELWEHVAQEEESRELFGDAGFLEMPLF